MNNNYAELPSTPRKSKRVNRLLLSFLAVCFLGGLSLLTFRYAATENYDVEEEQISSGSSMFSSLTSLVRKDDHDHSVPHIKLLGKGFHRRPAAVTKNEHSVTVFCDYIDNTIRYTNYNTKHGWADKWTLIDQDYFSYREPAAVGHSNGVIDVYSVWRFYKLVVRSKRYGQQDLNALSAANPLGLAMPDGDLITFMLTPKNTISVTYRTKGELGHVFDLGGSFSSHPNGVAMIGGTGYVFAKDLEGQLHMIKFHKRGLSAWSALKIYSSCTPELAGFEDGFVMVYCNERDHLVMKEYSHRQNRWVKERELAGTMPISQPAVAVRQKSKEVLVFARNPHNHLLHIEASRKHSKWHKVDGVEQVADAPTAIARGDHVEVFVVCADTGVRHIAF